MGFEEAILKHRDPGEHTVHMRKMVLEMTTSKSSILYRVELDKGNLDRFI